MTTLPETVALRLERRGSRLLVTLDDPATRNALSDAMMTDLEQVLAATHDDRSLHTLVIRGRDGLFCAGGNLKGGLSQDQGDGWRDHVREESRRGGRLFQALNAHPMAVIALVDGPAMGGGFGLACCADIVVTTARARFALSETGLGLVPAQIAPFVAARIGLSRARRLALTGERLDGAAALAIGLSDYHCETADEAEALVDKLARQIARCGPRANAATKALLLRVAQGGQDGASWIDHAAGIFAASLAGEEGREGIAAFLEKRPPTWAGGGE